MAKFRIEVEVDDDGDFMLWFESLGLPGTEPLELESSVVAMLEDEKEFDGIKFGVVEEVLVTP